MRLFSRHLVNASIQKISSVFLRKNTPVFLLETGLNLSLRKKKPCFPICLHLSIIWGIILKIWEWKWMHEIAQHPSLAVTSSAKKQTIEFLLFKCIFHTSLPAGGEVTIYQQNEQYLEDQISSSAFQCYLFPIRYVPVNLKIHENYFISHIDFP